jgi:predicted Zn finger-like uncharacterized protein
MPTVIKCPGCQKPLKLNESQAGKRVRCPACKQVFVVPPAEEELEVVDDQEEDGPPPKAPGAKRNPAVRAERPVRRSRPAPEEEEDEEEEERPVRRSRREPVEEEEEGDEDERPRRPRRRQDREEVTVSSYPLILGILSLVFCCVPAVGLILGRRAQLGADMEMSVLPGSSRYDGARHKLQTAKTLGIIGMILNGVLFAILLALRLLNILGRP